MSIGIYAFLRIYFFGFGVSDFAQFRTHCADSPAPLHRPDLPGAVRLVSSADRCSVSSVRACVPCLAWSALHLARPALLSVLCSPSGYAGGWGLHLRGIQGAPGVGQVMPAHSETHKKAFFSFIPTPPSQIKTHSIVQVSKNSKKYKKTPLPV